MSIRVGVDVGGTFTKAIAFDLDAGKVCAQAIVATTHEHPDGVAAGVVDVVTDIAGQVGPDRIDLVTHSTTQAVNALLEGDVAVVGMVGLGRAPDLRKSRKRTVDPRIEVGEGRVLGVRSEFLDVTLGLDPAVADATVQRLRAAGATTIAVAEAFAPDDVTNEETVAAAARRAGLPVTTSTELSGLYGLELRAVTAALNASILPIALHTAEIVGAGVAAAGVAGSVMVMRGDAGATDLAGFRQAPARTLYSGPAASVAGALRSGEVSDAVIVEVGGTSTNVAAVRRGRPALSYVRVASHSTAIRALDVRVLGVAGGSMLRARRNRVHGVGPRSAHIAGLPYACFLSSGDLDGGTACLIAPKPGDPADYLVVQRTGGDLVALTITCAANALGLVGGTDYARGDAAAARAGFAIAGRLLGRSADDVARAMMQAATQAVGDLVAGVIKEHKLDRPVVVAVGGGAGGLGRAVAAAMGLHVVVPEHAEVISAIGDALSLVRTERERAFAHATPADTQALIAESEAEAIEAGATAASLEIRVEHLADRGAVRVTCTGAIGLVSGAVPGRAPASATTVAAAAARRGRPAPAPRPIGRFWLSELEDERRVVVLDRYADVVVEVRGETLPDTVDAAAVAAALNRNTRRAGSMTAPPDVWVVSGARFVQVPDPDVSAILDTVASFTPAPTTLIIGRE